MMDAKRPVSGPTANSHRREPATAAEPTAGVVRRDEPPENRPLGAARGPSHLRARVHTFAVRSDERERGADQPIIGATIVLVPVFLPSAGGSSPPTHCPRDRFRRVAPLLDK